MRQAVLFDLGNTLASYYRTEHFTAILEAAISALTDELRDLDLLEVSRQTALAAAAAENTEAADHRYTPLTARLERIFAISIAGDAVLQARLCRVFLQPIFALGRVYEDAKPVLHALRAAGHPTAIVSNAPWGSPPDMWHAEIERLGLAACVDTVVMCGDVGWRKPARYIFDAAAAALDSAPGRCVFVGDDLHWDIDGSAAAGMRPVLIDRDSRYARHAGVRIESLRQLPEILACGLS